jgi:hypothetical protein
MLDRTIANGNAALRIRPVRAGRLWTFSQAEGRRFESGFPLQESPPHITSGFGMGTDGSTVAVRLTRTRVGYWEAMNISESAQRGKGRPSKTLGAAPATPKKLRIALTRQERVFASLPQDAQVVVEDAVRALLEKGRDKAPVPGAKDLANTAAGYLFSDYHRRAILPLPYELQEAVRSAIAGLPPRLRTRVQLLAAKPLSGSHRVFGVTPLPSLGPPRPPAFTPRSQP